MAATKCVIVDGPFPDQDRWGEEIPIWTVVEADENGEDVGRASTFFDYRSAMDHGKQLAARLHVEFIPEAMGAGKQPY